MTVPMPYIPSLIEDAIRANLFPGKREEQIQAVRRSEVERGSKFRKKRKTSFKPVTTERPLRSYEW